MPRIRKNWETGHAAGYQEGFAAGVAAEKIRAEQRLNARTAQLQAMEAVTKLISMAGQSLQSLSQVFDNGPRN